MSYEPKDNTGILFKNDRRENDRHPNAKGSALIGGVEYWVSSWTKEGQKGKFQSLKFEPKDQPKTASPRPRSEPDDEVPF